MSPPFTFEAEPFEISNLEHPEGNCRCPKRRGARRDASLGDETFPTVEEFAWEGPLPFELEPENEGTFMEVPGEESQEWEEEIRRGSPEYTAWLQLALNQILRLQLKIDGIAGPALRSAVRSFQGSSGLTVDGVAGSQTEQRLVQAMQVQLARGPGVICNALRQPEVLDQFDFDSDRVKPFHIPRLFEVAQCAVAIANARQPVPEIRMIGHTDRVGSDAYNLDLGRRRAVQVGRVLADLVDLLSPGLSARIKITPDTRGEFQQVSSEAARNRRVELLLPLKPAPPPPRGCPPFKARVRLHVKILQVPTIPIATMVANMKRVYGAAGFLVEVASTETLNLPHLADLDVGGANGCRVGLVTAEQRELFGHRNNVGRDEIAIYFVRSTDLPLNGCAAHPPGQPSAVVTTIASQWTLAHEVGHVLNLNHVAGEACQNPAVVPTRLMTGCGTGRITGTPVLIPSEVATMDASSLTINC